MGVVQQVSLELQWKAECGGNAGMSRQKDWQETAPCVSWEYFWKWFGVDTCGKMPLRFRNITVMSSHAIGSPHWSTLVKLPRCQCKPYVKAGHAKSQVISPEVKQPENAWHAWHLVHCYDIVPLVPKLRHRLIISTFGANSLWLKPRSRSRLPSQFCSFGQDERHEIEGLRRDGGTGSAYCESLLANRGGLYEWSSSYMHLSGMPPLRVIWPKCLLILIVIPGSATAKFRMSYNKTSTPMLQDMANASTALTSTFVPRMRGWAASLALLCARSVHAEVFEALQQDATQQHLKSAWLLWKTRS